MDYRLSFHLRQVFQTKIYKTKVCFQQVYLFCVQGKRLVFLFRQQPWMRLPGHAGQSGSGSGRGCAYRAWGKTALQIRAPIVVALTRLGWSIRFRQRPWLRFPGRAG